MYTVYDIYFIRFLIVKQRKTFVNIIANLKFVSTEKIYDISYNEVKYNNPFQN